MSMVADKCPAHGATHDWTEVLENTTILHWCSACGTIRDSHLDIPTYFTPVSFRTMTQFLGEVG